jgi:putative sporulation protein YtaF
MLFTFLIILAISIDSFCIGIAYGLKKLIIPIKSIIVINIFCILFFGISVIFGKILLIFININVAAILSTTIMITLGIWFYIQILINDKYNNIEVKLIKNIRIKSLGIVINILKEPTSADIDISGVIDSKEACYLGIALSLDSLAVGVGASLTGLVNLPISLLLLFIMNFLLITLGVSIGKTLLINTGTKGIKYLPSIILIAIGILTLL